MNDTMKIEAALTTLTAAPNAGTAYRSPHDLAYAAHVFFGVDYDAVLWVLRQTKVQS